MGLISETVRSCFENRESESKQVETIILNAFWTEIVDLIIPVLLEVVCFVRQQQGIVDLDLISAVKDGVGTDVPMWDSRTIQLDQSLGHL